MFVILALVALQCVFLLFWFYKFSQISTYIYIAILILEALLALWMVNAETNAEMKIAWLIPILIVPVFGTLFYVFVKSQMGSRKMHKKLVVEQEKTAPLLPQNDTVLEELKKEDPQAASLARYMYNKGNYPVYAGCDYRYFSCGEELFPVLCEELLAAKESIFLEFFIVDPGLMWNTILGILEQKVAEGVEVRFLYDGTCSFSVLPFSYPKQMEAKGIHCRPFSQVRPVLTTVQNNRDHRKILVIDGKVAFTGGINMADEYINAIVRFGYWKDTMVEIRGEAVRTMTALFIQTWNMCAPDEEIAYQPYLDKAVTQNPEKKGFVLPFGENPLDDEQMAERLIEHIIDNSLHYVHLTTPYLMLDQDMRTALTFAAKRGVDVHIIFPHVPDKWYAMAIGQTYMRELINAGVKISEYMPGFIHAKMVASDDVHAVVGTVNLDYRSLYLHYEDAVYCHDGAIAKEVEEDFRKTLAECSPITAEWLKHRSVGMKISGRLLRVLAPLF